ncbi:MAG: hypothetical protein JWP91_2906 [Fibrobacteres bacterium]|nr:hypothetical protein [Fibrobacterota bacterium]
MRYLKYAAMGVLALGMSSYAATRTMNAGVAYQSAVLDNGDYRPGMGVNGSLGSEMTMLGAAGSGGLGLRGNYEHYRREGVDGLDQANLNEGGIALTGMVGPNTVFLQPRVGGHVGYTRLEDNNFLEVGPDVTAAYKFTPTLGIQAMVTPTWLINQDNTNFHGTKMGLGITWSAPGV